MSVPEFLAEVARHYAGMIQTYGPTPRGVDWNSSESQALRFDQLLTICDAREPFAINDYGCGYGALIEHLSKRGYAFEYFGFDICAPMVTQAARLHSGLRHCRFVSDESSLPIADYTLASGTFNVKLNNDPEIWRDHVLRSLAVMYAHSNRGVAFNLLTSYADPQRMRSDLFYADPLVFFDYCKKTFSRFVTLIHDYDLYEFTILVRR